MEKKCVLVLASGGIDSTALIHFYLDQNYRVFCLHFQYGQPSAISEYESVKKISQFYNVPLEVINLDLVLKKRKDEYIGRNALFILIALSLSISDGFKRIAIGINFSSQYYDCSTSFSEDIQRIIDGYYSGTIQVEAPFLKITKHQIIDYCIKNEIPLELTYSCLRDNFKPCGKCDACKDRSELIEVRRNM